VEALTKAELSRDAEFSHGYICVADLHVGEMVCFWNIRNKPIGAAMLRSGNQAGGQNEEWNKYVAHVLLLGKGL
jgi:hypothetical protein